jgi:surface antigen
MRADGRKKPGRVIRATASGVVLATLLSGCNNAGEGAFSGAAVGALGGLAIGSLSGNAGEGAIIGAVSGAVVGGVVGDQNQRQERRRHYDD